MFGFGTVPRLAAQEPSSLGYIVTDFRPRFNPQYLEMPLVLGEHLAFADAKKVCYDTKKGRSGAKNAKFFTSSIKKYQNPLEKQEKVVYNKA